MIQKIERLEGLTIFLFSLLFYNFFGGNWLLFILLILLPDISMVGYIKNKKLGAFIYNLVHNYILGLVIILIAMSLQNILVLEIGVILLAHVGMDRFFGFGLKYPSQFKDTHIQKL
jgi:hypothetical protein